MKRFSKQFAFILVILCYILLLIKAVPFILYYPNGDEGIVLTGGLRLIAGQTMYTDFFSFWPPGSYLLSAIVIKFFGANYFAIRFAAFIGEFLKILFLIIIGYKLLLKNSNRVFIVGFVGLLAWFINQPSQGFTFSHHLWTQVFGILSILFFVLFLDNAKKYKIILAGIAGGGQLFVHNLKVLYLSYLH